jgi:hypothetical protein
MTTGHSRLERDRYHHRVSAPRPSWSVEGWRFKVYVISRADPVVIPEAAEGRARELVAESVPELAESGGYGAGFVILHRGDVGMWLLVHWWLPGGLLAELLWGAPLSEPAALAPYDRPSMANVWELAIIDFERRAWIATAMAGGSLEDYLSRVRPAGTC